MYRKWESGVSECWGDSVLTITSWVAWGNLYQSNNTYYNYPTNLFIDTPTLLTNSDGNLDGYAACGVEVYNGASASRTPLLYVLRPNTASTNIRYTLHLSAKGYWKTYVAPSTVYRWHRTA